MAKTLWLGDDDSALNNLIEEAQEEVSEDLSGDVTKTETVRTVLSDWLSD